MLSPLRAEFTAPSPTPPTAPRAAPTAGQASRPPAAEAWQSRLAPGARATQLAVPHGAAMPLCLVPGQWLLCLEGRLMAETGPQLWGQVMVRQHRWLDAGDVMEGGRDGLPVWLRLTAAAPSAARIVVIEAPRRPGILAAMVGILMRRTSNP